VLYSSFLVGWAAAGKLNPTVVFLLTATTALFLAHEPLIKLLRAHKHGARVDNVRYWRKWLTIFSALAVSAGLVLLLHYGRWVLLAPTAVAAAVFSVHVFQVVHRKDRSTASELLGIAGLTAASAVAYVGLEGRLEATAFLIWGFCLLYFGSGVFYVKMRISRKLKPQDFANRRNQCLAYHVAILAFLLLGAFRLALPWLPLLGFLPILGRAFWHAFRAEGSLNLRRIGYLEVLYTVLFTILMGAGALVSGL
jgi:hypothetical protein